jgi:hypothetical protein
MISYRDLRCEVCLEACTRRLVGPGSLVTRLLVIYFRRRSFRHSSLSTPLPQFLQLHFNDIDRKLATGIASLDNLRFRASLLEMTSRKGLGCGRGLCGLVSFPPASGGGRGNLKLRFSNRMMASRKCLEAAKVSEYGIVSQLAVLHHFILYPNNRLF